MILAPVGLLAIFLTPIVGKASNRVDPRYFATASLVIFAVVALMRAKFNTQVDEWTLIIPTIIQGAAVACFFIPLIAVSLSGLRPDQIAAATGLNNFVRITAGAFATSLATTFWESRAILHHAQLVEHVTRTDPAAVDALGKLGASGLSPEQAYGYLNQVINQQAFTLAALDLFQASAILLILLVPLVWLARPTKQPSGAQATSAAH
jgi:DHA2 family multidrug resistance protein